MRRRTFLAALGTTGAAGAGCLGSDAGTAADGTATETTRATDDATGTRAPTGQPPRPRFEGVACPSFSDADRTVCWHARDDARVYLQPSAPVFQPVGGNDAVETTSFVLHNERPAPVTLNPHSWSIHRRADGDGEWTHVAPDTSGTGVAEVATGETYEWVVSRESHPSPHEARTRAVTVPVSNGVHAFAVTARVDAGEEPTVECVALFDVERVSV